MHQKHQHKLLLFIFYVKKHIRTRAHTQRHIQPHYLQSLKYQTV